MPFILDKIVRDLRLSLAQRGPPECFTALSEQAVPWFSLEDAPPDPDMSGLWEPHPAFYWQGAEISAFRGSIFGAYAIGLALWRVRMSTIFFAAATDLSGKEFYAPTLGLAYTAAYHAVLAQLALMGRVVIDAPQFTFANRHPAQARTPPARIVGKLTRNGSWIFEPMRRDHRSIWMRLTEFIASNDFETPPALVAMLSSLAGFDARVSPAGAVVSSYRGKDWPSYNVRDHGHLLLPMIANERHIAFYQGFGEDPTYKEDKLEGALGVASRWTIHERSERMLDLAFDFLSASCSASLKCICEKSLTAEVRDAIRASVVAMFCDDPQPHEIRYSSFEGRNWRNLVYDLEALEDFVDDGSLPDD